MTSMAVDPAPVTGVTGEGNGLIEGPYIWAREASGVPERSAHAFSGCARSAPFRNTR